MVFPGPRAVSVQDMIQHLHSQSNRKEHHASDAPMTKRRKCDELGGSKCAAESSQTGSSAETKSTESRQYPLQRVVFIDSTWNQTNKISTDERLQGKEEFCALFAFQKTLGPMYIKTDFGISSRFATSRAEDKENLFLASSEGKTGLLPGYY